MHPLLPAPIFANALDFAFKMATPEGKATICALCILSLFSWTVIFTKSRQLIRARRMTNKFFAAYRAARDPLELLRSGQEFDGAPVNEVYHIGAEELSYHLKNGAITVKGQTKISHAAFDSVCVSLERAVGAEALSLEKRMIVLTTAVAGGPFIGLLGTVWGVMETFAGIAQKGAASLSAMAPGVAGALIATVVGLLVAIPAMFAYNFMVTAIRAFTQELDNFSTEFSTHIEHQYVDNRPLADEIADAFKRAQAPTPTAAEREREAVPA